MATGNSVVRPEMGQEPGEEGLWGENGGHF